MNILEELSCDGVAPSGPVSAWPASRDEELRKKYFPKSQAASERFRAEGAKGVNAGVGKMAKGLLKTGMQAVRNGRVTEEIRNERYETCKACPFFIKDSKRCSDCGCFMEAKTWVGGDPDTLCPQKKWSR